MYKALQAFLLFAAMVALPLVIRNFEGGHDRAAVGASALSWLFAILLISIAVFTAYFLLKIDGHSRDIDKMISSLKLAERDFNNIINNGWDQTGRFKKVDERERWARMGHEPMVQIFNAGYRTVAHDAFDANTADMKSRGATMGKAGITAFLLRELYEGRVGAAKTKVEAEYRNGADTVYIAPGIDKLIGYDKFDMTSKTFPKDAGVNGTFLKAAVDIGGFPRDIAIVKTDKVEEIVNGEKVEKTVKTVVRGVDALRELVQQGRPPEPAPSSGEKPREKPSRFWRIAKAIWDDWTD